MKRNLGFVLIPTVLAVGLGGGIFIGQHMSESKLTPGERKLVQMMQLINREYVDEVEVDSLLEGVYPHLMALLDPHSAYIPASDLDEVNEELDGSFSGVGVSFQILNDTVNAIDIIAGGPAERAGLQAGDKILKADTVSLTGKGATNENVYKNLRGKNGSHVKLQVKRVGSTKTLTFDVERGNVPVSSVDAVYRLADGIGYIKVSKFAKNTYSEFSDALDRLNSAGVKKYIVDLRGNVGGFMDQAIEMANQFLPLNSRIVYTKGRNPLLDADASANGLGAYKDVDLVVLTDENSASASEIFAGAMQDNDRGIIVGRRTFGKGLVQNQTTLPDRSALRLTVSRYYTPSGRSIQKEYKRGEAGMYDLDINERYTRGEFYHADSIKLDLTKKFKTIGGRTVYGGGGIMPDIFVPQDTTGYTGYYVNIFNSGLIQRYAYVVADNYRSVLKDAKTVPQLMKLLPRDATLLRNFVDYAAQHGVPARWYYIRQSQNLILNQLKAVIARDVLGYQAYVEVLNQSDPTVSKAVSILQENRKPSDFNYVPKKKK